MNRNLIARYVWIVDTLMRYGKLSRSQLDKLWRRSALSNGEPLPDRTFFHYRRAIEEIFQIDINCNRAGEYYIEENDSNRQLTNMLLDSYAVNDALKGSTAISGRMEVEDVPSAREFLPTVVEAMTAARKLKFTYAGFKRSRAEHSIIFHPYYLKRYKQRWYMFGMRERDADLRTYALDRVKEMVIVDEGFEIPEGMDPAAEFANIIGITASKAPVRKVVLRATPIQAKYFRALPFHPSQREEVCDGYSVFSFDLKLNYELVHEIIALGNAVKVVAPAELTAMVTAALRSALALYGQPSGRGDALLSE